MPEEARCADPAPLAGSRSSPLRAPAVWAWLAIAVLIAARVVILSDISLFAITPAAHDDAWFVRMAEHIAHGEWLGPYNQLTLIKGQGYPLFAVVARALGAPLRWAQDALYIGSCLMVLAALWPRVTRWPLRVAIVAVLLFNPLSFHTGELGRVLREGIYPAQTCLVIALAIGLLLRREQPWRVQLRWAAALGFVLGWFWITREEAIWIIPTLLLILTPVCWAVLRRRGERLRRAAVLAAAVVPAVIVVNLICLMNWHWYGAYTTVEFRSPAFADAFGALLRIDTGEFRGRMVVSDKALSLAEAYSPAFARVQKHLQGRGLWGWRQGPVNAEGKKEIGGTFMWALRDAVSMAAAPNSAGEALAFYRQIATEVNQACDEGKIPAGPRSISALPWDRRYLPGFLHAMRRGLVMLVTYEYASTQVSLSIGKPAGLDWFSSVTRSDFAPLRPEGKRGPYWREARIGPRHACRAALVQAYQWCNPVALGLSFLWVLIDIRHFWRRQGAMLLCIGALAVAVVVRIVLLAWIDVTAFDAINPLYLSPVYLPMLCIPVLVITAAIDNRRKAEGIRE